MVHEKLHRALRPVTLLKWEIREIVMHSVCQQESTLTGRRDGMAGRAKVHPTAGLFFVAALNSALGATAMAWSS